LAQFSAHLSLLTFKGQIMSAYINSQIFSVLPEPILKNTDLDLKIKISGVFGATNWLNINKEDLVIIEQVLQNSYDRGFRP
jgi:hypothetical protein